MSMWILEGDWFHQFCLIPTQSHARCVTSYLISLSLSIFVYQMRLITPTLNSGCKDDKTFVQIQQRGYITGG